MRCDIPAAMKRSRLVVSLMVAALSAAACGKKKGGDGPAGDKPAPPPAAVVDAAAPPPPPIDAAAIDAGPAPLTPAVPAGKVGVQVIDRAYGGVVATGLPAIKGDGSAIAVVRVAEDGGRGYLDATVEVIDVKTGVAAQTILLADPDKTSDADGDVDTVSPARVALDGETAAAVGKVNELLATGDWRAMPGTTPLSLADGTAHPDVLTLGARTFKLDMPAHRLTVEEAGKPTVTLGLAKLYKLPKPADEGCGGDVPFLRTVFADDATGVALAEIGFSPGGHNCGAGPSAFVVVRPAGK